MVTLTNDRTSRPEMLGQFRDSMGDGPKENSQTVPHQCSSGPRLCFLLLKGSVLRLQTRPASFLPCIVPSRATKTPVLLFPSGVDTASSNATLATRPQQRVLTAFVGRVTSRAPFPRRSKDSPPALLCRPCNPLYTFGPE